MDQAFAMRLVDLIEDLALDNFAMRVALRITRDPEMTREEVDSLVDEIKQKPDVIASVQQQFEPYRAQLRKGAPLEEAIWQVVASLKSSKQVN